jgi:hypothetical protein
VDGVRDRVGVLCGQLERWPTTEKIIREAGAGAALDELRAALTGDAVDPARLAALLDAIEDACARSGLVGITSREHGYRPLPPGLPLSSAPAENAPRVCPLGQCDRVVFSGETDTEPMCVVSGGVSLRPFPVFP